jgi:beta-N-acetylhexosaminidase
LGSQGVIFGDDLDMAVAGAGGSLPELARAAREAGCDMVLVCNNRTAALEVLAALEDDDDPAVHLRCLRMHGRARAPSFRLDPRWQKAVLALGELEAARAPDLQI